MAGESKQYSLYRPRFLTLVVLIAAAAAIVVANLSHDDLTPQVWPPTNQSFGWPLIWYWCEFKPGSALIGGGAPWQMNLEIVRWSGPRLAGNITIWLVLFVVVGVACQWPLRRYGPHFPNSPRLATLVALIVVAAPIVLANLSHNDFRWRGQNPAQHPLYGWPLIWRWRNIQLWYGAATELDEHYSAARLAGNLALWLVMLGATGGASEWLLRRYQPRLRWSLRTMLGAVGLAAACCAWFAALRHRASLQDPIISTYGERERGIGNKRVYLYLERWGPKWLDLVGVDRFRRRVVGADVREQGARHEPDEELLKHLQRLSGLRYLNLGIEQSTPSMAAALANMRQLRILRVGNGPWGYDLSSDCLEAIGRLAELEELHLLKSTDSASLAHLASLTNLKSLSVQIYLADWDEEEQEPNDGEQETDAMESNGGMQVDDEQEADESESGGGIPLFEHLPALPRLETIDLRGGSIVDDEDLRRLAILPRLKSLNLSDVDVSDAGLANLASLKSLEELAIGGKLATPGRLESMLALKRLKKLHILRYAAVTEATLAALEAQESLDERANANQGMLESESSVLSALQNLRTLRIDPNGSNGNSDRLTTLALDHGDQVFAMESEVDDLRRALNALRQSNPGIVIDSDPKWFDPRRGEKRQEALFLLAPVR